MIHPEVEHAVALYNQGYTCAQSILAAFAGRYGLTQSLAIKIGEPFGAGVSCTGGICGSITGAIMVLGLQYGSTFSTDLEARSLTYQHVHELTHRFQEIHKSIQCPDLLGYNLSDPQKLQIVVEEGLFASLCPILVRDAARILVQMLEA